jgi:glycosyltransferase involved in cell wall biosynthesis
MNILIASTIVPFIEGGATYIVDSLHLKLKEYGYKSEVLKIPFFSYYPLMLDQMKALRLINIDHNVDKLITIRTPSYLLQHPNKVIWFIHHHRGAYDLWGTKYQDIPNNDEGLKIRQAIMSSDNEAFEEAKKIFTNSKVVSNRLKKFNNIESEVLYPPLLDPEKFYSNQYGNYIFYPSRITHHKRQHLAIEAMKYTKSGVKLIIAGKSDTDLATTLIMNTIKKNHVENKVTFINRWISEEEKVQFISNSLACIYIPFDEDSYGYPTLEAFHAKKAIITCTDSGGTLELVENNCNGFISSPDPKQLAHYFDQLFYNKKLAEKLGNAGLEKIHSMNITWDNVIRRLVQ